MKQVSGQMSLFDLDMPCGRTSPEHSLPTKGRTSASSSKSFAKSKTKEPMFLDLSGGGGNLAGVSWETGIPWLGASSTLNFGEYPNVAEESGLSQILEESVPQRYYLSERACVGVLRRAERRGKELKPILKLALEQQIERWRKYGSPLPVFEREEVVVECYDARGNGDGKVVPTITGDHNGHLSDYTALLVENKAFSIDPLSSNSMKSNNPHSGFHETSIAKCLDTSDGSPNKNQGGTVIVQGYAENSSGGGISGTIDASYYKGVGSREGKEREFVVCETHCYSQDAYDKYEETEHGATLRASGGIYGGGSENLVCAGFSAQSSAEAGLTFNENLSPTLQVGKCAAVVTEHHTHEEVVRMREGKEGGGKGALVQEDKSGTIACNNDQVLFQHTQTQYVVRRLTPLECCRLQGMPDFWTDGVEGSDAARYKLWGNGMALPNALYIMEGLVENDER